MEISFHWPITRQWRSTPGNYRSLRRFHNKCQSRAHPMCIASFQDPYIWFLHRHKKLKTFFFYNFQGWHKMIHLLSSIEHMQRMILVGKMLRSRLESFFHFGIHHRPYSLFQLLMQKYNCFQICCICFSIEKDIYFIFHLSPNIISNTITSGCPHSTAITISSGPTTDFWQQLIFRAKSHPIIDTFLFSISVCY